MKLIFLFLLISIFNLLTANEYELDSITCIVTKKDILEVLGCECNKKQIWIDINILQPMNDWSIQIDFFQKRGEKLFQVFKSPPVNWCKFTEGQSQLMGFQKVFINAFRKSAPRMFHPCPFEGKHTFNNVTASKGVVDMIPLGSYKLVFRGIDKDNNIAFTISSAYKIF